MNDPSNPNITHVLTLSEHNFIVKSLNRNPLGADVMEVSGLITKLNTSAKGVVDKLNADEAAKKKLLDDLAETAAKKTAAKSSKVPKAWKTAVADAAAGTGEPT